MFSCFYDTARRSFLPVMLISFVVACAGMAGAQVKLSARVEPDSATVGSTVVYEMTVQLSSNAGMPAPQLPEFDSNWGFSTPMQAGTHMRTHMAGSSISIMQSYRYAFEVSKEGTFNIPPAKIEVGGKTIQSNPVTLKVTKMPAVANVPTELQGLVAPPLSPRDPALAQKLTGALFVLPVVTNPNPYNGQQVRVSFHLCIDSKSIASAGFTNDLRLMDANPPAMTDFIKEDIYQLKNEVKFREQAIGGRTYYVAPLMEVAISSTKTGKITIEPFKQGILFSTRRSRGGPFGEDLFGADPFFSGMDPAFLGRGSIEVIAQSRPIEIDVKPLPSEGKPANFAGAVGEFDVTAKLDRDKAKANEDVLKLTVMLEGQGDASAIKPPPLGNLKNFTQLGDAKASAQGRKENDEYITTKKIEYILRPTQPGKLEVPPISFAVFNPKEQKYETLQSNAVAVDVAPGSQPSTVLQAPVATPVGGSAAAATSNPEPPKETDLRYIHTGTLTVLRPGVLTGNGPFFLAAVIASPLMLLAGYLLGRRRETSTDEQRSRRRKRAGELARKHLRKAESLLKTEDRLAFFAELARNLRTYFGDKMGVEPTGLTIENIVLELQGSGASEETTALAEKLLEQCDAVRYSPVQPAPEIARQAYNDALELVNRAERNA